MTEKDIEKIYDDLEKYLIRNIKRNLTNDLDSFHINEEKQLGFKWEAWQSAKLRELKRYRKQNKTIINKRLNNITNKIAQVLRNEQLQGKLDAFKNYKSALTHGYKSSVEVKDSFFKINDRKVNTLIKSVNNDFSQANKAVLRRSNDVYRQIIAEASMYNQTGVMTEKQAIKKAIDDFSARGIDCITYSNGAKHTISNYSKMAIRTASTRAHLQGEGQLRQKIGEHLILMSKHNTACKLCQPWESKVLIDDVYSGGTKEDGNYPLLSEAMKQGLYHPNCRHGHGTYYPELGKKVSNNIIEEQEDTINKPNYIYDSSLNNIDSKLLEDSKKQLTNLANKYPKMMKYINQNRFSIQSCEANNYFAATQASLFTPSNTYQKIILNAKEFRNYDDTKMSIKEQIKYGYYMDCSDENMTIYTITHEFGHAINNVLVREKFMKDGKFINSIWNMTVREMDEAKRKYKDEITRQNLKQIFDIAKKKDETIVIDDYLSKYGKSSMGEAFAEIFANSQCGKPNILGESMNEWLDEVMK